MGFFIFGAMTIGFLVGCVASVVGILVALGSARRMAKTRARVPHVVVVVGLGAAALIVWGVVNGLLPLEEAAPGSDYDIVMKNSLIGSVVVGASLGLGALVGVAAGGLCPRRSDDPDAAD